MTQKQNIWMTVLRQPGHFGKRRDERFKAFDVAYGVGKWRVAWEIPGYTEAKALDYLGLAILYEESYVAFLRENPEYLHTLVTDACDVYDDEPSNVASGFDYTIQETRCTHVQDIAIRRAVLRLGEYFRGTELIQIRASLGPHPLSKILSPGNVPFLWPEKIVSPQLEKYWWKQGSVEAFYQSNKVVQTCSAL